MRLCSRQELETNVCCGTGCGFDSQLIWTSTAVLETGDVSQTVQEKDPATEDSTKESANALDGFVSSSGSSSDGSNNNNNNNNNNNINDNSNENSDNADSNNDNDDLDNDDLDNDDLDIDVPKGGRFAGLTAKIKEALAPVVETMGKRIEALSEHLGKEMGATSDDVSEKLVPLQSKLQGISKNVDKFRSDQQAVKPLVHDLQEQAKELGEKKKVVGSALHDITTGVKSAHAAVSGVSDDVQKAAKAVKALSGSAGKALSAAASKDSVEDLVGELKGDLKNAAGDLGKNIKTEVEQELKKGQGNHANIGKIASKNQKYLKRIYKSLHHVHH
jgi:hypothetical protein